MNTSIRLLRESELEEADHIFRLAYGTFVGLPEPTEFGGDASYIPHRWKAKPNGAFAAFVDGKLVGSNLATQWGSFGSFGPLSVHPDFWNQKIAQRLIEAVMEHLMQSAIQQAGLLTFSNSPKHHALYQKFGFWQRFLTCMMSKPISRVEQKLTEASYSVMTQEQRCECLNASIELTNVIYPGLDVSSEISTVHEEKLGDTVFLWDETSLVAFAICHCGALTEAGSDTCYVKFAAVRPSLNASKHFEQLLNLCEMLTIKAGMSRLLAGVNTSHHDAYRQMIARGFRTQQTGIAMHKPNEPGFARPDVFVLNDWR
jgi:N-acetylglutamate synthase-like GNAT family acetyltransferase